MKISFKKYKIPKILTIIFLLIPVFLCIINNKTLDNDTWFLMNNGRYVIENGIPHILFGTIHSNLSFVMQNYLSSVIFYSVYNLGGARLLGIFVTLIHAIFLFAFYKLVMLVSDNKFYLSAILTLILGRFLGQFYFVGRPQIFSYLIFVLYFYFLELYIRKKNNKYLIVLPIISFIEVNLHGSLWWFLLLFTIPYLVEAIVPKFAFLTKDKYKTKPLVITTIFVFLAGFLNPYGYKMLTYLFISYFGCDLRMMSEVRIPLVTDPLGFTIYLLIILVILTYLAKRTKEIKLRYFCLLIGTIVLALSSYRNFPIFLIASIFPLGDYLKNNFKPYKKQKYSKGLVIVVFICILIIFISMAKVLIYDYKNKTDLTSAIDYLDKTASKDIKIFHEMNEGNYISYRGYNTYIDTRPEIYTKNMNKKEDILEEYKEIVYNEKADIDKFLEKYNFDYLVLNKDNDILKNHKKFKNYKKVYEDKHYKIYNRIK